MSYHYYVLFALIPADVTLTFSEVVSAVRNIWSTESLPTIDVSEKQCVLRFADRWWFKLHWDDAPYVIVESREQAEFFGKDNDEKARIASVACRVSTRGADDPEMEHFNDFARIWQALEGLPFVYIFQQ